MVLLINTSALQNTYQKLNKAKSLLYALHRVISRKMKVICSYGTLMVDVSSKLKTLIQSKLPGFLIQSMLTGRINMLKVQINIISSYIIPIENLNIVSIASNQ